MNMKKIVAIACFTLIILSSMAFHTFSNGSKKSQKLLRPAIMLYPNDIFPLREAGKVTCTDYYDNLSDSCLLMSEYLIYWSDKDCIWIDEFVFVDKESAFNFLVNMHRTEYNHPDFESLRDEPATIGDISYLKGREFIRDNIIIKVSASKKFESKLTAIASQIDKKIMQTSFISYSNQLKPVIHKFEITKDSVKNLSETKLIIEASDPNHKNLEYSWKFNDISETTRYGKIKKDESGCYYYVAEVEYYPQASDIKLTLIVKNEVGFGADSTINFHMVAE